MATGTCYWTVRFWIDMGPPTVIPLLSGEFATKADAEAHMPTVQAQLEQAYPGAEIGIEPIRWVCGMAVNDV